MGWICNKCGTKHDCYDDCMDCPVCDEMKKNKKKSLNISEMYNNWILINGRHKNHLKSEGKLTNYITTLQAMKFGGDLHKLILKEVDKVIDSISFKTWGEDDIKLRVKQLKQKIKEII